MAAELFSLRFSEYINTIDSDLFQEIKIGEIILFFFIKLFKIFVKLLENLK